MVPLGSSEPGWRSVGISERSRPVRITGTARMEMDGYLEFQVKRFRFASGIEVKDIRLEIPVTEDAARYMMGLGKTGGFRPEDFRLEMGSERRTRTPSGSAMSMPVSKSACRAENYSRPLNTNFYLSKPLEYAAVLGQ